MLEKYGLKLDDTLLAEPHQMELYDDLINNHNAKLIPGGAAQNTARGAQYMLPADSVWYVGSVGDDDYAKTLRVAASFGMTTSENDRQILLQVYRGFDGPGASAVAQLRNHGSILRFDLVA